MRSSSTTAGRTTATSRCSTTSRRRRASTSSCAGGTGPELYERLRREGDDTPADVLVTTDLANLWRAEDAGLLQGVVTPTLEENVPPELHEPDGDVVGDHHPAARPRGGDRPRVARARSTSYEDLGDPRFRGRTLPAHVEQRVQPVARRRHDRQAGGRGHRGAAALVDGQRPDDHQLRRRAAGGDGRRRLRRRPGQPLLPGPRPSKRIPTSRSRPRGPTRTGPAPTPTCRASASSAGPTASTTRSALIEYLTSPDGAGGDRRPRRVRRQPLGAARARRRGLGGSEDRPHRRSNEAGPLLDQAVAMMLDVGWN